MPNFLTTASTIMCPHGGSLVLITGNTKAFAMGSPILTVNDVHSVTGCLFNVSGAPSPCVSVRWQAGAVKVAVNNGQAALLQSSVGLCYNAANAPQGAAVVANTQLKGSGI